MRTFFTLFVLVSLVLLALVATAAPRIPTLNVGCTLDSDMPPDCVAGTTPTFSGSGLNMHKSYCVQGSSTMNGTFCAPLSSVDKQGNYSELSADGFLVGDTWTFTLWELDHNGFQSTQLAAAPMPLTFD